MIDVNIIVAVMRVMITDDGSFPSLPYLEATDTSIPPIIQDLSKLFKDTFTINNNNKS